MIVNNKSVRAARFTKHAFKNTEGKAIDLNSVEVEIDESGDAYSNVVNAWYVDGTELDSVDKVILEESDEFCALVKEMKKKIKFKKMKF